MIVRSSYVLRVRSRSDDSSDIREYGEGVDTRPGRR